VPAPQAQPLPAHRRLDGVVLYRDEGVVLRTHKLAEADRIVTLLTRHTGRVRAVAKGVRRTRSRFGARLEPGSVVDLQLWGGRNLDVVSEAVGLHPYGEQITDDYATWTTAQAVLETAERFTAEEREPALRLYLLTVGALRSLAERDHAAALVLDAYLLRALTLSGYEPALGVCAGCGAPGPHRAFSVPAGGSVCARCRPAGAASPSQPAVALMADLLQRRWPEAEASDEGTRRQASGLTSALLSWHLERGLRSLPLVERA